MGALFSHLARLRARPASASAARSASTRSALPSRRGCSASCWCRARREARAARHRRRAISPYRLSGSVRRRPPGHRRRGRRRCRAAWAPLDDRRRAAGRARRQLSRRRRDGDGQRRGRRRRRRAPAHRQPPAGRQQRDACSPMRARRCCRCCCTPRRGARCFSGSAPASRPPPAAEIAKHRVDAVELLPEVIDASAYFHAAVFGSVPNPRLHLIAADARRFVRADSASLRRDRLRQLPSGAQRLGLRCTPWSTFAAVRDVLAPRRLFCQWLPLHQLDLDTLRSIVRTFLAVYPERRGRCSPRTASRRPCLD